MLDRASHNANASNVEMMVAVGLVENAQWVRHATAEACAEIPPA